MEYTSHYMVHYGSLLESLFISISKLQLKT